MIRAKAWPFSSTNTTPRVSRVGHLKWQAGQHPHPAKVTRADPTDLGSRLAGLHIADVDDLQTVALEWVAAGKSHAGCSNGRRPPDLDEPREDQKPNGRSDSANRSFSDHVDVRRVARATAAAAPA